MSILLAPTALTVIDFFRALDDAGLRDAAGLRRQFGRLSGSPFRRAEFDRSRGDMIYDAVDLFLSLKTTMPRQFDFKHCGSPVATRDEITFLILLSAAGRDRFGIAGEAVLRLGLRDAVRTLRIANALGKALARHGVEIGEIDRRLMQDGAGDVIEDLLKDRMSRLCLPQLPGRSGKNGNSLEG